MSQLLTPEEFKQRWPTDESLVRFNPKRVSECHIPESARQFLTEAGLPLTLYISPIITDMPRLPDVLQTERTLLSPYNRYRLLGEKDFACFDCIDEEANGRIVQVIVWDEGEPEVRFVNTSIQQYAACWLAWNDFYKALYNGEVGDIGNLEDTIRATDPAALEGEHCIWYRDIARLKEGHIFY